MLVFELLGLIGLWVAWVSGSSGEQRGRVVKTDRGAAGGQWRVRDRAHVIGRGGMAHVIMVGQPRRRK